MKIGDKVKIVKCEVCPKVVGKVAKVTMIAITEGPDGGDCVEVKFGKGRPQKNRPNEFFVNEVVLVTNE